jgi:hypothetical protein
MSRRITAMYDPGLDRHEWESELQALEDDLRDDPADALGELEDLVTRAVFDHPVAARAGSDTDLEAAEEP